MPNEALMKQLVYLESQLEEHRKLGTEALHDYIDDFHRELQMTLNACMKALQQQMKEVA